MNHTLSTGELRQKLRELRKSQPFVREFLTAQEANGLRKGPACAALTYLDVESAPNRAGFRRACGLDRVKTMPKLGRPVPEQRPVPAKQGIEASIGDLVADLATNAVNARLEDRLSSIEEKLAEAAASAGGGTTTFSFPNREPVVLERTTHEILPDLVEACNDGFNNLLLVGPAGTGKTTLAADLAAALSLAFGSVSCTAGLSESVFTGRILPTASGEWTYRSTDFVRLFTEGGVFLADEWDAADPNLLTLINSALANGRMSNPVSGETMQRHEDFVFVAAGNTWGYGADRTYVGRNPIDGATMDRTVGAKFYVDYSENIETSIINGAPSKDRAGLRELIGKLRAWISMEQATYVVGTRAVVAAVRLLSSPHPKSMNAVFNRLTVDWDPSHQTAARNSCMSD